MTPMEPIPETVEAVNELDESGGADDMLAQLIRLAAWAEAIVPDLVGVSIGRYDEGLTFTLVASAEVIAVLDAIQYAAGGPCVDAAQAEQVKEFHDGDVLDEERWRLFAEATAAHTVRSTLTLPVVGDGGVVGTVNLYAGSRRAFVGHHQQLAEIFGAWAAGAVSNADLSFATRRDAEASPGRARDQIAVDVAVGILATQLELGVEAAEARLRSAAARAGVSEVELARSIIEAYHQRGDEP